ncbi:hypothetical protein M2146_002558 [Lachnospiraceae bacterium PF1-22]
MKKLEFEHYGDNEAVQFTIYSYPFDNLAILAVSAEDGELWNDVTINLPGMWTEPDEAYISGDLSKELIDAMVKANIMTLPGDECRYNMGTYKLAVFNMDVLKEYVYPEEENEDE